MFKEDKIRINSAKDIICLIVDQLADDKELRSSVSKEWEDKIDFIIDEIKNSKITNSKSLQFKLKNKKLYYIEPEGVLKEKKLLRDLINASNDHERKIKYFNDIFYFLSVDLKTILYPSGNRLIKDKIKQVGEILKCDDQSLIESILTCNIKYCKEIHNLLDKIGDNLLILVESNNFSARKWHKKREKLGTEKLAGCLSSFNNGVTTFQKILDSYFSITIENLKADLEDSQNHLNKISFN